MFLCRYKLILAIVRSIPLRHDQQNLYNFIAGYNSGPPRPPLRRGGIQKPGGRRSAPAVDSDGNVAMSESGGDQSTRFVFARALHLIAVLNAFVFLISEIGRRGRISPTRGRKRRPNRVRVVRFFSSMQKRIDYFFDTLFLCCNSLHFEEAVVQQM